MQSAEVDSIKMQDTNSNTLKTFNDVVIFELLIFIGKLDNSQMRSQFNLIYKPIISRCRFDLKTNFRKQSNV